MGDIKDVTVNDTQKEILREMKNKPSITYDELGEIVNKSRRTIIRQVNELKEKGMVKRVGSDKKGHWEIIEGKYGPGGIRTRDLQLRRLPPYPG